MDSRLLVAAWNGNVETLYKLIEEDRRILHAAALKGGENPLHISCLAGHLHFVQELIKLMPSVARELNQDGFSPLHIASAKGYLEIVRELLCIDKDLCLIEGTDDRIPLHCAVIKGRVEVVKELISVNMDSVDHITARGETALHLAVKNNQFKVFQVLVEHIKQVNKEGVLNMKDDQGNTFLHLAVAKKLYQVVDLLLNEQLIPKGTLYLNSSNKRGLNPLDVLQLFQSEAGDRELEHILRGAGARTSQDLLSPTNVPLTTDHQIEHSFTNDNSLDGQSRPKDDSGETINFLLVIAVLVVTATYQALQSPPGGFWQEDQNGLAGMESHTAGKAVFATKNSAGFIIYVLFNTIGFYISLNLIYILTSKFPMRAELNASLLALGFTYGASLSAISPDSLSNTIFMVLCVGSGIIIWLLIMVRRKCTKDSSNDALSGGGQERV